MTYKVGFTVYFLKPISPGGQEYIGLTAMTMFYNQSPNARHTFLLFNRAARNNSKPKNENCDFERGVAFYFWRLLCARNPSIVYRTVYGKRTLTRHVQKSVRWSITLRNSLWKITFYDLWMGLGYVYYNACTRYRRLCFFKCRRTKNSVKYHVNCYNIHVEGLRAASH